MIAWSFWTSLPAVKLWEAVALVLEIEPRSLKREPQDWMGAGPGREADPSFLPRSFPSKEKCRAFDDALDFAERAANFDTGPIHIRSTPFQGMSYRKAEVALPEVIAFFVRCQWPDIPAPLLALVPTNAEPAPPVAKFAPAEALQIARQKGDDEWRELARDEARRIIKQQAERGLFPPQESIADEIAADFRARKPPIHGTDGKPLSGATIKRHALKGISSATKKARATQSNQGK